MLITCEHPYYLYGGREGGREGREVGEGGRGEGVEGGKEGGRQGREGGEGGREGGRDACYTYSNKYVQFFFYIETFYS